MISSKSQKINEIRQVKRIGFSFLTILSLVMALFIIFNVTYPLTSSVTLPQNKEMTISLTASLLESDEKNNENMMVRKASYYELFKARVKQEGALFYFSAIV